MSEGSAAVGIGIGIGIGKRKLDSEWLVARSSEVSAAGEQLPPPSPPPSLPPRGWRPTSPALMEVENSTGTLQLKRESINDKAKVRNDVDKAGTHDENINGSRCFNMKNNGNSSAAMITAIRNKILMSLDGAYLVRLSAEDAVCIAKRHPLPSMLILSLLFFMRVEYTLQMVPSSSPPLDVGSHRVYPWFHLWATHPQLGTSCSQHCVCCNTNGVHILDPACRREAEVNNRCALHVA